ncbi:MAG: hypothetical protein K2L36_08505 [Eubacterium sp.]|nr:hypothetical protein [Eubacterium sp.]
MKKVISFVLFLSILMCSSILAYANDNSYNEEYDASVAEIMKTYQENPDAALAALEELDTVLLDEPTVTEYTSSNNGISTYATNPTDYTFSVYSYKRAGSTIYHLQWLLQTNKKESSPGPLDFVSLEWDTACASYYLSKGDGEISTVKATNTGIVLFNVQDKDLKKGGSTFGTVQVNPTKRNTTLKYGSKFIHTYTSLSLSGSASYSFSPSASVSASGDASLGLSYTMGYTVNLGTKTNKWQLWTDNAVKI